MSDYRPNVGVVLFNRQGKVWYGRRAHTTGDQVWQFPQGGVDAGEDLTTAALRELREETGVTSVTILERIPRWIVYDFPAGYGGSKAARGWKGQKQAWFAMQFNGRDTEIQLDAHGDVEFETWRWGDLSEAPGLIIDFKRQAYEQVVAAFAKLADSSSRRD